jgi:hypothetical protein
LHKFCLVRYMPSSAGDPQALKCALPEDLAHLYVHFTRDMGTLDDFGSSGVKLGSSGVFEGTAQPGRYRLSVCEMAPPRQDGYTRMTKEFASAEITVGAHDADGLEIQVYPATAS